VTLSLRLIVRGRHLTDVLPDVLVSTAASGMMSAFGTD